MSSAASTERVGPIDCRVDPDLDPFLAVVAPIWGAQEAARPVLVPAGIEEQMTGGVHGSHDVILHRAPVPGERLHIWADRHGNRPAGRNASVTLRYSMVDAGGDVVAEQWWTTIFLGVSCGESGEPAPEHRFPDDARDRVVGTASFAVDVDLARRHAELTGDWAPHHFDMEGARRNGFERPFLHGLRTMALCADGVAEVAAGGDRGRLRRVAVRFASPLFLDEELQVRVHDAGPLGIAFEGESAGVTVVSHGRAELR